MAFPPNFTGNDGTQVISKAYLDTYDAEMSSALVDAGNPTVTPAQTTAEVIAARGNLTDLNTRLGYVVDADGNPVADVTSNMVAQTFLENLGVNANWRCWPKGDAVAPAAWTLSGAGAAVARDTGVTPPIASGAWSCKVTPGAGAVALLTQDIAPAAIASRLAGIASMLSVGALGDPPNIGVIGLCKTANANEAGLYITASGVGTSIGAQHGGGSGWEIVYAQQPLSSNTGATLFTALQYGIRVVAGGAAAWFSPLCPYLIPSGMTPRLFVPERWVPDSFTFSVASGAANGTSKFVWPVPTHGIVTFVQLRTETATAADWIMDVNTRDSGGTYTTMYAAGTRPRILNGAKDGGAAPDDTYARRCFTPFFGATAAEGGTMTFDLDSGGGHGADVWVTVHYLKPAAAWAGFYNYDTI